MRPRVIKHNQSRDFRMSNVMQQSKFWAWFTAVFFPSLAGVNFQQAAHCLRGWCYITNSVFSNSAYNLVVSVISTVFQWSFPSNCTWKNYISYNWVEVNLKFWPVCCKWGAAWVINICRTIYLLVDEKPSK